MAQSTENGSDSLLHLKRYRSHLEENIVKLQKSLRHWQLWEAEYEGLKEEILGLGDGHTKVQLKRVGDDFGGELIDENDIKALLEDNYGQQRDSSQIIDRLNKRIDYVQHNVKSITLLLQIAEAEATASVVLRKPEILNEEGLPLTEIREELDEEGNVISSSTASPSDATPQIVDAIRKAIGKGDEEQETGDTRKKPDHTTDKPITKDQLTKQAVPNPRSGLLKSSKATSAINRISEANDRSEVPRKSSIRRKKGVSFAQGTKVADATDSSRRTPKRRDQRPANALTAQMRTYVHNDKILDQLNKIQQHHKINQDVLPSSDMKAPKISDRSLRHEVNKGEDHSKAIKPFIASIPKDESPEDSELRRQMIKYNMRDVGVVVAEMDMDDKGTDSSSDNDDEDEGQDDSSVEEDEDQFGRTNRRMISDDYRKEMEALEQKMNAKLMLNAGPSVDKAEVEEAGRNDTGDKTQKGGSDFESQKTSSTKEVRFVDDVGDQIETIIETARNAENNTIISKANSSLPSEPDQPLLSASSFKPSTNKKASLIKNNRQAAPTEDTNNNTPTTNLPPSTPKSSVKLNIIERSAPTTPSSPSTTPHTPNPSIPTPYKSSSKPPSNSSSIINAAVIERPYTHSTNTDTDPLPDELDPALLQQQVAIEYHRMRNRMIQRQGGFLAEAEEEANEGVMPLAEEEGGEKKKMSRFKAARLRQG